MTPEEFIESIKPHLPALLSMAAVVVAVVVGNRLIRRRYEARVIQDHLGRQLLQAAFCTLGAVLFILALPTSDEMKGQLLTLAGLLGSAVIGLSSTTFVGNAMAGLMLSALGNFRPGDYLRVGEHFGRISERGLFHTEIQTENRRLTSLPNLYLVTNPIEVVPSSRTIVGASISLGYDISRTRIDIALTAAADHIGLKDAFVQVKDLGDYSVTYRVAGVLEDVRSLISSHSALRGAMLDALHSAGIEIVSPAFENQRSFATKKKFIPEPNDLQPLPERLILEEIVFDKADLAVTIERLAGKLETFEEELETLQAQLQVEDDPDAVTALEQRVERKANLVASYRRAIQQRERERTKL